MSEKGGVDGVQALLRERMGLAKCRKCGCMKDALDNISASLRSPRIDGFSGLREDAELWLKQMQPAEYT